MNGYEASIGLEDENDFLSLEIAIDSTKALMPNCKDFSYIDLWAKLVCNNSPPHKPSERVYWSLVLNELTLIMANLTNSESLTPVQQQKMISKSIVCGERWFTKSDLLFLSKRANCIKILNSNRNEDQLSLSVSDYANFIDWWIPMIQSVDSLRLEFCYSSPVLIHGFISREETEKLLLETKRSGIFLFRFSDKNPGHLALGFTDNVPVKQQPQQSSISTNSTVVPSSKVITELKVRHVLIQVHPNGELEDDQKRKFTSLWNLVSFPGFNTKLIALYPGVAKQEAFHDFA
jgi:hypothetical protein